MDNISPNYNYATLSVEAGMWRIVWYNLNPASGQVERVRKTFALNRIKDEAKRSIRANDIIKWVNEALDKGWNCFTDVNVIPQTEPAVLPAAQPTIPILQALEGALKIRKLGKKLRTADTYTSFVNKLCTWLKENNHDHKAVSDFTPAMFQEYLFSKNAAGHGNRNLNDHTNFFKTTFEVIRKKMKLITVNPIENFDYLPEPESKKFQPITADEIARIVPALIAYNPRFYLYCKFIPDEYIRPHHIARLQGRDINYGSNEILVGGDTAKNNRSASKQLMQPLKAMLLELGYDKLPGNHYLFASKDFAPGAKLYSRLSIRAAEIWKTIVIDGLGIHKQMYALKHTSAQYFVNNNANVDVYYLRQQLEHSSAQQTEIYLQKNVKKRVKESEVNTLKF